MFSTTRLGKVCHEDTAKPQHPAVDTSPARLRRVAQAIGAEISENEHRKRPLVDGHVPCCPICGLTLRPGETDAHLSAELDKLELIFRGLARAGSGLCHNSLPDEDPRDGARHCPARRIEGCDDEARLVISPSVTTISQEKAAEREREGAIFHTLGLGHTSGSGDKMAALTALVYCQAGV
ncbi:hypothetical protein ACOMHN_034218 [Nucella lapillus]